MGVGEEAETQGLKDEESGRVSLGTAEPPPPLRPVSLLASVPAAVAGLLQPLSMPTFQGEPLEEVPGHSCTLHEPVTQTILRDLRSIAHKLIYVLMPMTPGDRGRRLKDWDLWGPLLLCLALGLILSGQAPSSSQASYAFADVFVTVWVGSGVVTLNALLLKGHVSFFQTVCVLGYCIFPLVIAAFIAMLCKMEWLKVLLVAGGLFWAGGASVGFVAELVPEEKKLLGLYPVWLFYVAIAWMILLA